MKTIQQQLETFHKTNGLKGAALTSKVKKEMKLVKDNVVRQYGINSTLNDIPEDRTLLDVFVWSETLEGTGFWLVRQQNIHSGQEKK